MSTPSKLMTYGFVIGQTIYTKFICWAWAMSM